MTAAGSAMAQDASQSPHRIVLPLPKAAMTEASAAPAPVNPSLTTGRSAASAPDADNNSVMTPNMEAARAAVAALNRAAAASSSAPATNNTSPAAAPVDGVAPRTHRVNRLRGENAATANGAGANEAAAMPSAAMLAALRNNPDANPVSASSVAATTAVSTTNSVDAASNGYNATSGAGMMHNFDSSEPAEESLHVMVGRSIFVDTKHRLTRVYVTDPEVLNSYTSSPNQIVVTALKAGTSTVMVWDESGESQAYVVSADMNVATLQNAINKGFPADAIEVHGDEGRALLTGYVGTAADEAGVVKLATQYTKDVSDSLVINSSRVKQVRLKVRIVEVDRSKLAQFGFNFFSNAGNSVGQSTTGAFPSSLTVSPSTTTGGADTVTVSNPLNFLFYSSKFNVGATLQDLANMNILQILAEPTITTMSGIKASFLAGGEFPFPVVQGGSGTSTASVTIEFRPYGVKLDFTPRVNPDGTIDLKVSPEVSALDYANAVSIAGYTIPAISSRKADTQMVLQSGQSFAISGLLDQRTTDTLGRTPGISSIPILGELFKSKSVNHSIDELIVIVTPTLVDPLSEPVGNEPDQPKIVVPMLKPQKFDKELPKAELKQQ
jgi:pilus assembly protein CpaC